MRLNTGIYKETAVVVPTFNESDNIERLIRTIFGISTDLHIIVVDDNSPDETWKIVKKLQKEFKNLDLILRDKKDGRGGACLDGFAYALSHYPDLSHIIEMDADFSHDPKDIPRLLEKAQSGCDLVIGSRYIRGSKILNWGLKRRIFSKLANIYARMILGIPIMDYTNGYRCYSKEAIQILDKSKIKSKGYIVLSEIAYQIYRNNFSICEIPIVFLNRKRGASNVSIHEIINAFTSVTKIKEQFK